jgi:MoaA/NifB/PqqE/SkfB family radical SAM enzyme
MYSTDPNPIQHIQCDYVPAKNLNDIHDIHDTSNTDTLCIKPWIHLYVGTDGNVLPCCVADNTRPVSTITNGSINNIANAPAFVSVRKSMLQHKRPIECSVCYKLEEKGIKSNREISNDKWRNEFDVIDNANQDGSVDNFKPSSVDFRLSNTCNFKCRICTGYASSRIQLEEKENNIINVQYNTLSATERNNALTKLLPYLNDVKEIYFAGGEPLLIKEHYVILDYLLMHNKQHIALRYNSNLSRLMYKDKNIISYWKQFSNIELGISIDEMGVSAEYSRSGTVWNTIVDNLTNVSDNCPHININITSTFSIYSAFNLIKLQRNWIENNKVKHTNMLFQILTTPSYVSVQLLPLTYKKKLTNYINEHIEFLRTYNSVALIDSWELASIYLNAEDNSFKLCKFFKYNDALDNCRNETFETSYPEYSNLRKYCEADYI